MGTYAQRDRETKKFLGRFRWENGYQDKMNNSNESLRYPKVKGHKLRLKAQCTVCTRPPIVCHKTVENGSTNVIFPLDKSTHFLVTSFYIQRAKRVVVLFSNSNTYFPLQIHSPLPALKNDLNEQINFHSEEICSKIIYR